MNCVGTYKMAHFPATIWHTISSDISINKTCTNNFIFRANVTQIISSKLFVSEKPASLSKYEQLN